MHASPAEPTPAQQAVIAFVRKSGPCGFTDLFDAGFTYDDVHGAIDAGCLVKEFTGDPDRPFTVFVP